MLLHLKSPAARHYLQALEASSDPVYGGGFRRARKLVADHGFERFLEHLRVAVDFPPGY
jgi:hypothetical protein